MKVVHEHARSRILLILLALSLAGNLLLAYFVATTNLRLTWLTHNLQDTTTAFDRLDWRTVTDANQAISDRQPIQSMTLPKGWVYSRSDGHPTLRTLTVKNTIPVNRQSLTWLTGSTIESVLLKQYDSVDEFMAASEKMYNTSDSVHVAQSFEKTTIDGHPAYRAQGHTLNRTVLGTNLTPPSPITVVATWDNGYVVEFDLLNGAYSTDKEIAEATTVFNDLLSSVKLTP